MSIRLLSAPDVESERSMVNKLRDTGILDPCVIKIAENTFFTTKKDHRSRCTSGALSIKSQTVPNRFLYEDPRFHI